MQDMFAAQQTVCNLGPGIYYLIEYLHQHQWWKLWESSFGGCLAYSQVQPTTGLLNLFCKGGESCAVYLQVRCKDLDWMTSCAGKADSKKNNCKKSSRKFWTT